MSENTDGALHFSATLDIDNFNVSSEAMERRIIRVSDTAVQESARMEQSILSFAQNGARYIVSYLVGNGMMQLVNSIVQTRGQFQQLEIAFGTMLQSEEKAKNLMDQMIDTAAKTPFDLAGVAGGAKQLLAYGTEAEKVNDTLVRLGNIASGLSIPLQDIVYLYGTTMVQGRLYAQDVRQFTGRGIPLVKELAAMYGKTAEEINTMVSEGKIGFPEVEKVINKLTNSGGQFYNLMEKQSYSLTGQIANLGDAWDMALNKLGKDNQNVFASGIEGATYLVEHLDDILRIVKAITIAYGSYKAAIVLNTLVTKGYTGVALLDNTARQAKIALMKADAKLTGENAAITKKMEEAEKSYIASLQARISLEQHEQALHKIKVDAINELLTADQKRHLSNKGLTASSQEYVKEAESVLSVEQKASLAKQKLSTDSRSYADAIENLAKKNDAHINSLKNEAKELEQKITFVNQSKSEILSEVEAARYEVYWAKQGNDVRRIENAERRLSIANKRLESVATDANAMSAKKEKIEKELATIATKNGTAAGAADVITKNAQTGATNILTAATNKLKLAFSTLRQAIKANPLGWIMTGVGLLISAFTYFNGKTKEAEDNITGLAKATKNATDKFNEQAAKVDALRTIIENSNISYNERNKSLKELKEIIPGYNAELNKEGVLINSNTEAIEKYLIALEKQIKLKAAQEELEAAYKKKRELEKTESAQSDKYWNIRQTNTLQGYDRNSVTAKLSRAVGIESEDNAKKALDETQSSLREVNRVIESLNSEIKNTSVSIDESTKGAKSYSEQLEDAKNKVSSLEQELKDLRSGKVEKENLATEIESKIKELNDAKNKVTALTGKTPKSESDAHKKQEQLDEKQKQADLELERARIEIMEDGYAKRKALLDLQHKQALLDIDKEEKELEKARKEAGKGALSDTEKKTFDDRRSVENQSYEKAQNKLFDGELDYKKSQYTLYFRWVKNMGKEVADTHFSELLKEGNSYKSYIEKQIQELTQKKNAGTLTEGEGNHLIALNMQYDEITGAKTAMDSFKESVSIAIGRASTLAEKIQAIADAKERLANGGTGLVGEDEQAEASLFISEQEVETNKELQDRVLSDFKTYEEQKKQIQDDYALLRQQALVQNNAELLAQINKGEAEALSALNAQMLMQTDSWNNLFSDLDALTIEQIDKLITDIQQKMNTADLKMNPADMKAILDRLDEAKQKIIDVNPFKSLGNAIKAVFGTAEQKSKHSSGSIKDDWKKLADATEGCFDFVNNAIDGCEVLSDLIGDNGKATIQMLQGVAMAGIAMAASIKTAEKGSVVLAAISIALQAIQWISGLFNNDDKLEKRIQNIQKNIDALANSFDRLQHAVDQTYWVYSEQEKASHEQRVQAINDEIAALEQQAVVAKQSWNFVKYAELTKQIKDLKYALEKEENKGDMFQLYDLQRKNLEEQQRLIEQQIVAEKDKKKTDWDKIAQWEEAIKDIDTQLEDMEHEMMEALAGTDIKSAIDEFADAMVDAYLQGENAADALGKKTKEVLKNAVVEALKRNYLAKGIEEAVKYLGSEDVWKDNMIDEREQAEFERLVNLAGDNFNKYLGALDGFIDKTENAPEDPLTGAVRSMSEETGSVIAGRLNAFIINQSDQTTNLRQSLLYQQEIAANTRYNKNLESIAASLKRIENNNNSLLSQGIS